MAKSAMYTLMHSGFFLSAPPNNNFNRSMRHRNEAGLEIRHAERLQYHSQLYPRGISSLYWASQGHHQPRIGPFIACYWSVGLSGTRDGVAT